MAADYGISRATQDQFAANSFAKAVKAQKAGYFKSEIVPVQTFKVDPKTETESPVTVSEDDGIRYAEALYTSY